MTGGRWRAEAIGALALVAGDRGPIARGDELLLERGTTIQGRILVQDSGGVTIDAVVGGIRAKLRYTRPEIRSITLAPLPDSFFEPPPRFSAQMQSIPSAPMSGSGLQPAVITTVHQAERGSKEAMWALVKAYESGDGVPPSPASKARWLRRLCELGEEEAHIQLAAQFKDEYARLCKARRIEAVVTGPGLVGGALEVAGRLSPSKTGNSSLVDDRSDHGPAELRLDLSRARLPSSATAGRVVNMRGMLRPDRSLLVLDAQVPEPKFEYRYELEMHPVLGGTEQDWTVTVIVTNTGRQPIQSLDLSVRCSQIDSPNQDNPAKTVSIRSLAPGERRTAEATFSLYNFLYIGRTSVPKVEVSAGKLDW